jgi:hypothetical protein
MQHAQLLLWQQLRDIFPLSSSFSVGVFIHVIFAWLYKDEVFRFICRACAGGHGLAQSNRLRLLLERLLGIVCIKRL